MKISEDLGIHTFIKTQNWNTIYYGAIKPLHGYEFNKELSKGDTRIFTRG